MASYRSIQTPDDLPPSDCSGREKDTFDAKHRYEPPKIPFEIAKDVAAMVNRLGGTIFRWAS